MVLQELFCMAGVDSCSWHGDEGREEKQKDNSEGTEGVEGSGAAEAQG